MPKLSAAELKDLFDIVSDIKPVRLDFCLAAAERTLRGWVTTAAYDENEPSALIESLKFAEAHLAVYHLLLNTGVRIRRSGLIKKEQESGASVQNNAGNEYFSASEIAELRREFYRAALDAAQPLRPQALSRPKANSFLIGGGWAR